MNRCYVCGEAAAQDADPRSPTCERCAPVRDHVISQQTRGDCFASFCPCGWRYVGRIARSAFPKAAYMDRDEAVQEHWQAVIKASADV